MSTLREERAKLVAALVGEPATFTSAPGLDAIKALPALLVEPAPAGWLDAATDSGPGRIVLYTLDVDVVVNAAEPIGAQDELDDQVELVVTRLPPSWRFNRAEGPQRVAARGGELTAISGRLSLSMRYSIKG